VRKLEHYIGVNIIQMSRVEAKLYLEMWLSEQIPTSEWLRILQERKDVAEVYQKHLEEKRDE